MKSKVLLFFFFALLQCCLMAEQTMDTPKGQFRFSPPSKLRESKLKSPNKNTRDIQIWNDDLENIPNFELSTSWEIGVPEIGPDIAHGGVKCLGTNLNGLYPNNSNSFAKSPLINIPMASYVELTFFEWFELESSYDYGYVEILSGSVTSRIDARSGTSANNWRQTALNLSQFAGQSIQIVFHLTSDSSVPGAGWYIDDLNLVAQESLPLMLNITGLETSNFPSIYINATVYSETGYVNNLTTNNFNISENSTTQTSNFTVITPSDEEQSSSCDIVFVLDVTSSMTEEIEAVKQNMLGFVNSLIAQNVDYRIGFVVFGDIVYIYNNYEFYTNSQQILSIINSVDLGEHGIGYGGDGPENQVEAMAEASYFQWRPGAARVEILLTDANTHENDYVTQWTLQNLLAERLIPNDIIVFPIFDTVEPEQLLQYIPIAEETNSQSTYFNIYDNFIDIINQISNFIGNIYTIHYTSSTPLNDPLTRMVHLLAASGNYTAEDYTYYLPGTSPMITRTEQTIAYDLNVQSANENCVIGVNVNDRVPPNVQSVVLLWRHTGESYYIELPMSQEQSDYFTGMIHSNQLTGYGIEYFFRASDGQTINTLPSSYPTEFPFSFALNPNQPAVININSQTYNSNAGLSVIASANSNQSLNLKLYYRPMGSLIYKNVAMTNTSGNIFTANINQNLSDFAVQFFVKATSSQGLITYKGLYDNPYLLLNNQTLINNNIEVKPSISLLKCSPNPIYNSNSTRSLAKISFELSKPTDLKFSIYNVKGEKIRSQISKNFNKGTQTIWWDLKNSNGIQVSNGIYFYTLESTEQKLAGKMLILK